MASGLDDPRLDRSRPVWAALALLVAGCVHGRAGTNRPMHPHNPPGQWYVVEAGDTMADIAARAHVPLEDLREINGLGHDEAVPPGRLLFILDADGLKRPTSMSATSSATSPVEGPQIENTAAPLRWPLARPRLTSGYGMREGRVHEGIDLGAPHGTSIYAAAPGTVLYAGDAVRGYGNMVVVQHAEDLLTVYAHNSLLLVRTGDRVGAGQEIARVGQSGRASAPHLHFEVRRGQIPQDPLRFLPAHGGTR